LDTIWNNRGLLSKDMCFSFLHLPPFTLKGGGTLLVTFPSVCLPMWFYCFFIIFSQSKSESFL
jgi:hypothetical protein